MRDVVVKAKAKLGKIPNEEFYFSLANEDNFEKKVNMLKRFYPDLNLIKDKIGLEAYNFNKAYAEIKSLDYFLKGYESDFFNLYFSKYEILFLQEIIIALVNDNFSKNYLRFIHNPLSANFILEANMDLENFININIDSKYYRTILPFLNRNMQNEDFSFLLSNALVKYYYRSLIKLTKNFPTNESRLIREFIGEEINLLNFEMIYRLKTYYDINDTDIFNFLINGGNGYKADRLRKLSLLSNEEFLNSMKSGKYKNVFVENTSLHKEIRKREYKLYRSEIRKEESDILYVISAMNLIFIHVENIDALLELDDSFTKEERLDYLIVR